MGSKGGLTMPTYKYTQHHGVVHVRGPCVEERADVGAIVFGIAFLIAVIGCALLLPPGVV